MRAPLVTGYTRRVLCCPPCWLPACSWSITEVSPPSGSPQCVGSGAKRGLGESLTTGQGTGFGLRRAGRDTQAKAPPHSGKLWLTPGALYSGSRMISEANLSGLHKPTRRTLPQPCSFQARSKSRPAHPGFAEGSREAGLSEAVLPSPLESYTPTLRKVAVLRTCLFQHHSLNSTPS